MKPDLFYIEFAALANIFSKLDYSSEEWRDWNKIHHLISIIESLDHKDSNSKGGMFCVKIAGDMCEVVMNTQHSFAFGDISDSFDDNFWERNSDKRVAVISVIKRFLDWYFKYQGNAKKKDKLVSYYS